jgi:hypothetical protein
MLKPILITFFLIIMHTFSEVQAQPDFPQLSVNLLEAVKANRPVKDFTDQLAQAKLGDISKQLDTDPERKAFWINVYNAYVIILLRENPDLYGSKSARDDFFTQPRITIAGQELSFDDIEHGILRRSKVKLSAGYLGKLFVDEVEKKLRVDEVDWHIHFALNCGAEACPPVEIYRVATLEQQLADRATSYLTQTTVYKPEEGKVYVTPLMSWFRADFGSLSGVRDILKAQKLIPQEADPSIEFKDYDWTLDIDNFAEGPTANR